MGNETVLIILFIISFIAAQIFLYKWPNSYRIRFRFVFIVSLVALLVGAFFSALVIGNAYLLVIIVAFIGSWLTGTFRRKFSSR